MLCLKDSGFLASNNEFSDYQFENDNSLFLPNSISNNNFKFESEMCHSSPLNNSNNEYTNENNCTFENDLLESKKNKLAKTSNLIGISSCLLEHILTLERQLMLFKKKLITKLYQ